MLTLSAIKSFNESFNEETKTFVLRVKHLHLVIYANLIALYPLIYQPTKQGIIRKICEQ